MQAIYPPFDAGDKRHAIYNLFAAYFHSVQLAALIESVERARRDAKLRYVVLSGALCSYRLSRAKRLESSYLRSFALELREELAQTQTRFVISILFSRMSVWTLNKFLNHLATTS